MARQSLGSLLVLVLGVAASIVLARALGAEARGEYGLAVKAAGLVLAIAQWGIPEMLLQVLGERREPDRMVASTILILGVALSVLLALVAALVLPLVSESLLRGVDPLLVALALVGSVVSMVGLLSRRLLQLDGRIGLYNGLDVARMVLFLAGAIGLAGVLAWQAFGAMAAWLAGEAVVAVLAGAYVLRRFQPTLTLSLPLARTLLVAGASLQLGSLATYVGSEAGAYVVNGELDLAAVGVYAVALAVARLVLQVPMALRTVLQPRLVHEMDPATVTAMVTRHGVLWMAAACVGLSVCAPLVPYIFGVEFNAAPPVLVLLLPGMLGYGLMQLLTGYLLRRGQRAVVVASACAFAMGSIGLQLLGVRLGGLPGAALGLSLAYLAAAVVTVTAYQRASERPVRELAPGWAELRYYVVLLRQVVRRSWRTTV